MSGKAKTLDEVTQMIEKRGWNLYEAGEKPRSSRRRTTYERAVENLEETATKVKARVKEAGNPKMLLEQIISVQKHLDMRFAAKKGGVAAAAYAASHTFDWLSGAFRKGQSMYAKEDVELISEQRATTTLLIEQFGKSGREMRKSYGLLEEYRLETARDLQSQARKYVRIEKDLSKLEGDESGIQGKLAATTAAKDDYAQLLHAQGNVRLERQKLVNEHERVAHSIRSNRIGLDEIADYQMVISESEQVLTDAVSSLEQVSTQQAIAQAVLSAFVEGEASMGAAYQVMQTLSANIATTHRTINHAFDSLNNLAVRLSTGRASASTATESSRGLYGSLRESRSSLTQDVHQYVKGLFEKPAATGSERRNGYHAAEALPE